MLFSLFIFFINMLLILNFTKIAKLINLFDKGDNKRKFQKKPVASQGGFLLLINFFLFFLYKTYQFHSNTFLNFDFHYYNLLIFFLGFLLFFLIGLADDKFNISANKKLLLFLVIILFILSISDNSKINFLKFSFIQNTLTLSYLSIPFTILCIMLFINALNMFDGINLNVGIYSIFIFLVFILKGVYLEISVTMILSLLFFGYLNLKNKCFLGNNGSLSLGFIIAYLFINSQYNEIFFYADEIFLIMLIPGLDLLRLAIYRIYKKKHPFHPDRNHIHHLLQKKYTLTKVLMIISSIIIIPNIISLFFGGTIYLIVISIIIYFFIILKFRAT